jgi:hypothetical protein
MFPILKLSHIFSFTISFNMYTRISGKNCCLLSFDVTGTAYKMKKINGGGNLIKVKSYEGYTDMHTAR